MLNLMLNALVDKIKTNAKRIRSNANSDVRIRSNANSDAPISSGHSGRATAK